jgi:hypothetical protein
MTISGLQRMVLPAWPHRLFASSAAAIVLVLSVFVASPQLHRWLHPDADQQDHECAITLCAGAR